MTALRPRPTPAARAVEQLGSPVVRQQLALGRAAVGAALVLRPGLLPRVLGADPASSSHLAWVQQMLGAREIGLGLGAAAAGRAGDRRAERPWLLAGLLSDGVDAVAIASAVGSGRVRRGPGAAVVAVACAAVAVQAGALGRR